MTASGPLTKIGLPALFGTCFGAIVVIDPLLSREIARVLPTFITLRLGVKIPFLFTLLLLSLVCALLGVVYAVRRLARYDMGTVFLAFYIIGVQTVALSPLGKINGGSLTIFFFFVVFLWRRTVDHQPVRISVAEVLNFAFLTGLLLSAVNGGGLPTPIVPLFSASLAASLCFLIVNLCEDRTRLRFLFHAFIGMCTISSLIAILQELCFYYFRLPIVGFISQEDMQRMFEFTSVGPLLRVPAFTGTYAFFAYFLATSLLMIMNMLIYAKPSRRMSIWLASASVLISVAIVLTFSRYTLVALGIAVPLNLMVRWPSRIPLLLASTVILLIGIYGTDICFHTRLYSKTLEAVSTEIKSGEFQIRVQLAREGINGFLNQHPWIGRGGGLGQKYCGNIYRWGAHGAIIRAADEGGLLVASLYAGLMLCTLIKAALLGLLVQDREDKAICVGLFFAFLAAVIIAQFDSNYIGILVWFLVGTVMAADFIYRAPQRATAPSSGVEGQRAMV